MSSGGAVIEPTAEMVQAAQAATCQAESDECMAAALTAAFAIAEKDRLDGPAAIRCALEEALDAAIPIAGGPLLPALKSLKRALDRVPKATS
jgi:hypothetical protein